MSDEGELRGIRHALMGIAVLLFLILLVLVVPHILDIRQRIVEKSKRKNFHSQSIEEKEIDLARNTLYKDGVVSTIIARVAPEAVWNYFCDDLGGETVEVKGTFPSFRLDDIVDILNQNEYFDSDDSLVAEKQGSVWKLSSRKVEAVRFRIQFHKHLADETPRKYNNYSLGYREIEIFAKNITGSVKVNPSDILEIFEAYIRKVLWNQEE